MVYQLNDVIVENVGSFNFQRILSFLSKTYLVINICVYE